MPDSKIKMEIPAQVRELAEKSLDQTDKAFSSFMEAASKSVSMVPGPITNVAIQALAITESNLKAFLEHAKKLVQVKEIDEIMQLQSEFMRNQFGAAAEQFKQILGGASSAANDPSKEKPDLILMVGDFYDCIESRTDARSERP
jgi:phasin